MNRLPIAGLLLPILLSAQWLTFPTPNIPRTADGKPNLAAPAPRTSDGKPDLTGLWRPEANPYGLDLIQDLKDEAIFRPEAENIFLKHIADLRRDDPQTHCYPGGPSQILGAGGDMYRIVQAPNMIALLYERDVMYRSIWTDGRALPKDPNPTWMGYSVARWDGDTLVVESSGFNDRTWLDRVGHPHSEGLRVTERFRRVDFGHMQFQITYNDPKMLTGPLTRSFNVNFMADTDTLETICAENERDTAHFTGKAGQGVKLSESLLKSYVGSYEFREGVPRMREFFGTSQTLSFVNGRFFINALPLIAESETMFDSPTGAAVRLVKDSTGGVTQLVLSAAEGDARYERKK